MPIINSSRGDFSNEILSLSSRISTLENQPSSVDWTSEINSLKNRLTTLESEPDAVDWTSEINSIKNRLTTLESGGISSTQITAINGSITSLINADNIIRGSITSLINTDSSFNSRINSLESTDVIVFDSISSLISTDTSIRGSITSLISADSGFNSRLNALESTDVIVFNSISSLISTDTSIRGSITSLISADSGFNSRLTSLETNGVSASQLTGVNQSISSLQATDINISNSVVSLSSTMTIVQSHINALINSCFDLASRIAAMDTRVNNIELSGAIGLAPKQYKLIANSNYMVMSENHYLTTLTKIDRGNSTGTIRIRGYISGYYRDLDAGRPPYIAPSTKGVLFDVIFSDVLWEFAPQVLISQSPIYLNITGVTLPATLIFYGV